MKQCSKCKEFKDEEEFNRDKYKKCGRVPRCKACVKLYARNHREQCNIRSQRYRDKHRDLVNLKHRQYIAENRERVNLEARQRYHKNKERIKQYREDHKEDNKLYHKRHYEENKERIKLHQKDYYEKNKEQIHVRHKRDREKNKESTKIKMRQYGKSGVLYKTYKNNLTVDEAPRRAPDGIHLEVKCKYCNRYFIPSNSALKNRIYVLYREVPGEEGSLYCSEMCKHLCPTFNQKKYPKDLKPTTSREVDPLVRKLCFEADEWECQRCGSTESLICHHILGYAQYKTLSNDLTNVITFCEDCHKWVHSFKGCRFVDLRCDLKEEEE